jgi:lysyl-tRNA synthetase class II
VKEKDKENSMFYNETFVNALRHELPPNCWLRYGSSSKLTWVSIK